MLVGLLPGALVSAQAVDVGVSASASVKSGEYFTTQVSISGVTDFDAAVFTVVFDSDVLEIENPTVGGDISEGQIGGIAVDVGPVNAASPDVLNVVVSEAGLSGVTGSGYLCEIRFHAIGAAGASASVNLENGTLSNKDGELIPASWGGTTINVEAEATAPPVTPPSFPGGLSRGAMIGIVAAVVVVIALIVFFVVRRRRRYD